MSSVRSLYRRALRVAAACVPEHRSFAFTYTRGRFRDAAALPPGSHAYSERLSDGRDEVNRMVRLLRSQKRLSDESAARLLATEHRAAAHARHVPAAATMKRAHGADRDAAPRRSSVPPSQPIGWDEQDVGAWLNSLGLGDHAPAFANSRVNGRLLLSLDDEDLQELGVASRLQRKLILTRCEDFVGSKGGRGERGL